MKKGVWSFILMSFFVHAQQTSTLGSHVYGVVLAGGSGERLWPLSRTAYPKQLLAVGTEESLLEQAIHRLGQFLPKERIFVSTTRGHQIAIEAAVGDRVGGLLVEPGARNTAPALTLCCLRLYERDPQALIVFVPADPYIPASDSETFCSILATMIEHSARLPEITLCGVKPTCPATGYGYIAYEQGAGAVPVLAFKEKPSADLAQRYVDSGMMLWNTGIFCAQARVFLEEIKLHAPTLYDDVCAVHAGTKSYDQVEATSIDYAVLEKSAHVAVVPASFSWCDVGNLSVLLSLAAKNSGRQQVVSVAADNNLVSAPNKLVALVGVHDLCVVETDDVLLICKQSEAEQVRSVVASLRQRKLSHLL
jgi:mannose-1-phosphate guanylyltransferase/mannose-6-phosphate isomerase